MPTCHGRRLCRRRPSQRARERHLPLGVPRFPVLLTNAGLEDVALRRRGWQRGHVDQADALGLARGDSHAQGRLLAHVAAHCKSGADTETQSRSHWSTQHASRARQMHSPTGQPLRSACSCSRRLLADILPLTRSSVRCSVLGWPQSRAIASRISRV